MAKDDDILSFAKRRLVESIENGTTSDVDYWRGYIDGCRAERKNEGKNDL